jgi:integrase
MRRGEIMGLQWDDLNMKTCELKISRQVVLLNGKIHISEPKTKTSIRTIILPKDIVKMLARYKETINSKWMFPSPVKEDMPRNPSAVRKILARTLKKAGCKHIRFHDLRHTFATTALANGMDIKTLSAIIGHNSAATTLNIYTHITDEMQRNAAEKIGQSLGANISLSNKV